MSTKKQIIVTKLQLEKIKNLPQREMAEIIGCSQDTIRRLLKEHGLKPNLALVDLTGNKIGKWKVLKRDEKRKNGTFWICQCECGKISSVNAGPLKTNGTKSCKSCSQWEGCGELSKDFFNTIVRNAKSRNIDFDLTIEYLWELFEKQNKKCALTGTDLYMARNKHRDVNNLHSASLDRLDSSKGYFSGNVQWVHKSIQQMKWTFSQDEFIGWCKVVVYNIDKMK